MFSQQNQLEHPRDNQVGLHTDLEQEIAAVVQNDVHTNLHFCSVSMHWFLPSSHIKILP